MRFNIWKASTLVLATALTYVLVSNVTEAQAEPQPHMKAALEALQVAEAQLDKATSDKGGHRVAALKATREAIEQTKKGMAFDDKR